jgi:pilus assembly protein CpaD
MRRQQETAMQTVPVTSAGRSRRAALAARMLAAAAGCAILCGCNTVQVAAVPDVPTDYRMRHPIVIKEADRTMEVFVGNSRGALTPAQRASVLAFAQTWRNEATGGVVIDLPADTANARAAAESMHEIRSILAATGVPPHAIVVRPYHPGPRKLATVRINYPRIAAEAGPCGLWTKDIGPSFERDYNENQPYWNLGCATQRNLAAMVENPADLVQPRGETPPYAPRRSVVLDKYRKGESTATVYPNDDKSKISNVGK